MLKATGIISTETCGEAAKHSHTRPMYPYQAPGQAQKHFLSVKISVTGLKVGWMPNELGSFLEWG
jgi:hypothetical protein